MDQAGKDNSIDSDELIEHDEDIEEMIDWEEELENQFGGSDAKDGPNPKDMGQGFSKQKQVMEESQFYQGSSRKKVTLKDKTRKKR
jgi:hypothetical protein